MVLIVENSEADRTLIERVMAASVPSARLRVASTAAEALQAIHDISLMETVRLVLLDISLPDGSWMVLLEELRESDQTSIIPVVAVADADRESEIRQAYDLGARSVLVKPEDPDQYREMMQVACVYWLGMNLSAYDSRVARRRSTY